MVANGVGARVRAGDAEAVAMYASFKGRAANAFSRELYVAAFIKLAAPGARGAMKSMIPDCDCNPNAGGCSECVPGSCLVVEGCGEIGFDLCTGMCWG